eukprot:6201357-Amphidinium_carterae.1
MQGDSVGFPAEEPLVRTWHGLCPGEHFQHFACASAAVPSAALRLPSLLQTNWFPPYSRSIACDSSALNPTMEDVPSPSSRLDACALLGHAGNFVSIDTTSSASAISVSSCITAVEHSVMGKRE